MKFISKRKGGQLIAFFHAFLFVFFSIVALTSNLATAQSTDINVVFYNVENLFDTINNEGVYDEDFTPEGKLAYNTERYWTKLNHISIVLDSSFSNQLPDIIGLSEVENRLVLEHLITQLPNSEWKIIHFDSPDGRGIDNAIVFNGDRFELIRSEPIKVDLGKEGRATRDILLASFIDRITHEEIVVFVNHWPSRYGGELESNWKRVMASQTLQTAINSLGDYSEQNIIVMGDFNDQPSNESVLGLTNCNIGLCLVNLFTQFEATDNGTYVYKDEWGVLDQILVSKKMLDDQSNYNIDLESVGAYKSDFMLYENKKLGKMFPSRSYGGTKYYGGYSDHLPVKMIINTKS